MEVYESPNHLVRVDLDYERIHSLFGLAKVADNFGKGIRHILHHEVQVHVGGLHESR